ncbi:MAG: S-layer protein, partial [Pirellulaceae bacterium]
VCECERTPDENLAQALHTLNGDILSEKISGEGGRIAKLLEEEKAVGEMITEIYLVTVCRIPSSEEMQACLTIIEESPSPKEGYEDLMWAMINSKDFLYVK